MSIGAIKNINSLQRPLDVSKELGAVQVSPAANNPFAAANPLGQGANRFSAGFGAQAQNGGIEALLASAAGGQATQAQAPKKDEGDIVKLLISLLTGADKGGKKGDAAAADPNAAVAEDAAAEDPAASGCQDADGDGQCDDMSQCVDEDGDGACDNNPSCSGGSCGG